MKPASLSLPLTATLLFILGMLTGCQSTGSGGSQVTNNYYGTGYQDPWYYGDYHDDHDDHDVVTTPPPANRPPDNGLRPTHPIATPPQVSRPSPSPRPSIPTAPRPMARGGGGGRR
jgi:hypothetical protein